MSAEKKMFYWDGVDHEDLYCVCGTPHPEQIFRDDFPSRHLRKCTQCGTTAELDEETLEWFVRDEVVR